MQRWKLVRDSAELQGGAVGEAKNDLVIQDDGFASFAHPKLKFNFTVDMALRIPIKVGGPDQFGTAEDTTGEQHEVGGNANELIQFAGTEKPEAFDLPAKTATRPSPAINYVDVNYYNYRTKVATKIEPGTASVSFYDDADNRIHDIYQAYMNTVSPITANDNRALWNGILDSPFGAMSSLAPLSNAAGIIRTITVYHHYIIKGRYRRTAYDYINPKIQTFELDEVNMSESNTNTITLTFAYDSFRVETAWPDED